MADLFAASEERNLESVQPLAARMRPRSLAEFAGQQHFLGEGKLLRRLLAADRLSSVIFYGPPGTGKTTLARLLATESQRRFRQLSAVTSGVKDLRELLEEARVKQELVTGLLYINESRPTLPELMHMTETPLALLPEERMRPAREAFDKLIEELM